MVRISRFPLKDDVLEKLFSLLFEVFGKKTTKTDFLNSISGVLSPIEKVVVAKRIAIIYLLLQGVRHDVICKMLKVSSATVAKFALLSTERSGTTQSLEKLLKNERLALFFLEIFSNLFPPGMPGINWKAAWERKKALTKKKVTGF